MEHVNEWFWRHKHVRRTALRFGLMVAAWNVVMILNYLAFHGHLD